MQYRVLGWSPDGPKLRLDHRAFAYAGKFAMTNTGKAVAFEGEPPETGGDSYADVTAAVAFNEDRTDDRALWIRYVTVRSARRGEGVGPRLSAYVAATAERRGYERVRIAVNNVFAYHALHKARFGYAGRETGLAELVLVRPGDPSRYAEGLAAFADRDLSDSERAFIEAKQREGPPDCLDETQTDEAEIGDASGPDDGDSGV